MKKNLLLITLGLLVSYIPIWGQQPVKLVRLTSSIDFDGHVNEEAWNNLTPFELTQSQPDFGSEPTERSEVMLGYDDHYLWVGARLFMKDASKIIATTKKRDDLPESTDAFGILLDTFRDNENALVFYTTPTGSRFDEGISGDAATGGGRVGGLWVNNWENKTWNTYWDVKTTKDDKGWYVEMRIPFSSLKFNPNEENITTMGLTINRVISSNNEKDTWPAISPKFGKARVSKPSLSQEITIEGAKPSNPIYITPYAALGHSSNNALNADKTKYEKDNDTDWDIGLDLKYSINSKLTLDVTVNPDFAQVEADDQQVNLTRYSLFMAEKRQFFQERSNLFDFTLDGSSNLFYSRNIGLTPAGEAVRIFGGARLTGRVGKWDLGVMDMQTEKVDNTPSENFGIIRARRNVINANSYVGGIFTSRLGMNGETNLAYGLDGTFKVFGDDYLDVKAAQTYDSELDSRFNKSLLGYAQWERRSEKGFAYLFKYWYSGLDFNPGIGYLQRKQMDLKQGTLKYGWTPGKESKWYTYSAKLDFQRYDRLEDHEMEAQAIKGTWSMNAKSGHMYEATVAYEKQGVKNRYTVSSKEGVFVDAGEYDYFYGALSYSTPKSNPFKFEAGAQYGGFYDGTQAKFTMAPVLNFSSNLQVSLNYEYNHIRFSDRNMYTNLHNVGLKTTYMLSTKLSASLFTQYASKDDEMVTNIRLHYNPKEGNDFYIVFNDARNYKRFESVDLKLPTYNNSTIMLKYTYTFIL